MVHKSNIQLKKIKIGWNLGNTMDAGGETLWGNPVTTKEMFDVIKESGFNAIRIPITWEKHIGPAPEYITDEKWMKRVQEIVDYSIDNYMYTIINLHHEGWHFPSYDNYQKAKERFIKLWEQIAERFMDYDEHLIFEAMNEPRMFGTEFEWNGGNAEGREVVNWLNADFVETIRKTGGNNSSRLLMIPTYAASSDPRTWEKFIIPKDSNIIVSIHAYTPYDFALNGEGTSSWSLDNEADRKQIDDLMNNICNNFVSKGVPVIIGEFGARNKENLEARAAWAEYYVSKAAEKGIPCFWWDNGAFTGDGELFGLFDRRNLTWKYPLIVEALMRGLS